MVFKFFKRKKRFHRKRPFGRRFKRHFRHRKNRASSLTLRAPTAFPDRLRIKFRYSDTINIISTLGNLTDYVFRGNSLFDPDYTSTGHQPFGLDQWNSLYGQYKVYGSSIWVKALNETASGTNDQYSSCIAIVPSTQTAAFPGTTLAGGIEELPYARCRVFNNAIGKNEVSHYMPTHRLVASSAKAVADDDWQYSSAFNSNPLAGWFWHVLTGPISGTSETVNITYLVRLTYYCELYYRDNLAKS